MIRRIVSIGFMFVFLVAGIADAATYYIDYAEGSDTSATPTSKNTPWKTAPGMANEGSRTYVHSGGDRFIFKGGVTWPRDCFPWTVGYSGTSNTVRDYYGVDATWYTGASWSRPIFDLAGTAFDSPAIDASSKDYITFDNFEMKNATYSPSGSYGSGGLYLYLSTYVTVQNAYIHDWAASSCPDQDVDGAGGVMGGYGVEQVVDNCVIDGNSGYGACTRNVNEVKNSTIMRSPQLTLGVENVHDNIMHDVMDTSCGGDVHENGFEPMSAGDTWFYNNVIYTTHAVTVLIDLCWTVTGNDTFVFNNVFYNYGGGVTALDTSGNDCSDSTSYIFNNTFVGEGTYCFALTGRGGSSNYGTIYYRNNHQINCPDGLYYEGQPYVSVTVDNNLSQTTAVATADGYTVANYYAPTLVGGDTIGAGVDLGSYFTAAGLASSVDRINVSRPQSTTWDIGAYEYGGADTTPPVLSGILPSGAQRCDATYWPYTPVSLQVSTNENATCKYSTSDVAYDSMTSTFSTTGTTLHTQAITLNCGSSYVYYIRCMDSSSNKNTTSSSATFVLDKDPPPQKAYHITMMRTDR